MDIIFMNSETSQTSDPHRNDNLKRNDKYVALANLIIYYNLVPRAILKK